MPDPLIALVDCNNFYVSCERVFRPDLINQPVAVLSNNDGCIVARSQEVKDLGIKMATPVYKVQSLIKRHKIHLFSSNYTLYADMSQRVMQSLERYTPKIEVYSIDESFLDLTGVCDGNTHAYGLAIRQTIQQNTGITVCVGMAQTKTLAKLANYAAKKWQKTEGVLDLSSPIRRHKLLKITPVSEVWGIGRQTAARLQVLNIHTAADLAQQSPGTIQRQFNIVIARIVMELNAIPCLELEEIPAEKQQIVCSRSFKRRLTDYQELSEALASFTSRAAEKLRKQGSIAGSLTVFINTHSHNPEEPQYQRSISHLLPHASSDTRYLIYIAKHLLKDIFKSGYRYQKCGIQLGQLQKQIQPNQSDLFNLPENDTSNGLMQVIDQINQQFPKSIKLSAEGINNTWQVPVEYLSQHYTTNWQQLAVVKCV